MLILNLGESGDGDGGGGGGGKGKGVESITRRISLVSEMEIAASLLNVRDMWIDFCVFCFAHLARHVFSQIRATTYFVCGVGCVRGVGGGYFFVPLSLFYWNRTNLNEYSTHTKIRIRKIV